jgi:hypothetical protein
MIRRRFAMPRPAPILLVAMALLSVGAPAGAAALRCRALNGNVTCAGDGAASCQTVDGRTVCASGDGAAAQSFGGPPPDDATREDDAEPADDDACGLANSAAEAPAPASTHAAAPQHSIEQHSIKQHSTKRSPPPCAW